MKNVIPGGYVIYICVSINVELRHCRLVYFIFFLNFYFLSDFLKKNPIFLSAFLP